MRDVAQGMIQAAAKGSPGHRYILANERSSPLASLVDAANTVTPGYRLPPRAPKWLLLCVAWLKERVARLTGTPANLLVSQVRMFYGIKQEYSIAKARTELGYQPKPPEEALRMAFAYLSER